MLSETLLDEIRGLHAGPDRGYHGWSHPLALLALHAEVEPLLHDPEAVRCAILLHDAVYEPRRTDNESRSAALAARMLEGLVPDETLSRTIRLIEATARHAIPADLPDDEAADMALFLDMDLAILGAEPDAFDAYEKAVRREYGWVEEPMWRAGRAAVLKSFLARPHVFHTRPFRQRFEARARENLARSLQALQGQP